MADEGQQRRLIWGAQGAWNAWRSKNQHIQINLSGVDLAHASLKSVDLRNADLRNADLRNADLRNADLRNADLRNADLRNADLREANLYKSLLTRLRLSGADLRGANLHGANLSWANLSLANFHGADLSESKLLGANLQQAVLAEAKLTGVEFQSANLSGIDLNKVDLSLSDFSDSNLSKANLSGAILIGANLSNANLSEADLIETDLFFVDLSQANLDKANLSGANLSGANLSETNLSGADFFGAILNDTNLSGFDLSGASLNGVSFVSSDLRAVDFREANLSNADFSKADLRGASFGLASLQGANFKCANLMDADLHETNLNEVNFCGTNLSGANLSNTQVLAANFEFAIFTGACLKDWNTNRLTKFNSSEAEYVYLGCKEGVFSQRRPHSSEFKPGEFAALFQQALDTLDLIFVDGIDWQAFFSSFQELRNQYDTAELNVQAIERKSGDAFVVRLEVSEDIDKIELEQAAKSKYERQLHLMEQHYQSQLQLKDSELKSHKREGANMFEITKLLASKPINVEHKSFNQTNYGGTNFQNDISGGEVNQAETINVDHTSITTNAQGATIGNFANQMSGNASQTYNAAPDKSLAEAAQEIQALLDQLSQTYPSKTMLQKAQFADAAAAQAKANPTLRQRLLSAVDAGTIGAIEELLSHPVATFFIAAVKDWESTNPD